MLFSRKRAGPSTSWTMNIVFILTRLAFLQFKGLRSSIEFNYRGKVGL